MTGNYILKLLGILEEHESVQTLNFKRSETCNKPLLTPLLLWSTKGKNVQEHKAFAKIPVCETLVSTARDGFNLSASSQIS